MFPSFPSPLPSGWLNLPRIRPASHITLKWLQRLRWGAVLGQLFTIAIVQLMFGISLPVVPLLCVIGTTVVTNFLLARRLRAPTAPTPALAAGILMLDTLSLTALLAFTGGATNPFAALYVVHVTLAVVVLGSSWGWLVVGLSTVCYGMLFFWRVPITSIQVLDRPSWILHLLGMWLSFLVAASVIAYFVGRMSQELRTREHELNSVQAQIAQSEKLASLNTLAAGAAHELGTPLATIAVIAKELERSASLTNPGSTLAEDARLIREECERCRVILAQMSAKAGETVGEVPGPVDVEVLLSDVRAAISSDRATRLEIDRAPDVRAVLAPRQALVLVLVSLVRNAFDASTDADTVTFSISAEGDRVRLSVRDRGSGMSPEVLSRAGDPFFSTKPQGRGTGLGLFLARAFAERVGGRLLLTSAEGAGTTAALELPGAKAMRAA